MTPKAIKDKHTTCVAAEQEVQRITALIEASTPPGGDAFEAELRRLNNIVEDTAADFAAGAATQEALDAALAERDQALTLERSAAKQRDIAAAARRGLERRLEQANERVDQARHEAKEALCAWAKAEAETAERAYVEAAGRAADAFARFKSLSAWLVAQGVKDHGHWTNAEFVAQPIGKYSGEATRECHPGVVGGQFVNLNVFPNFDIQAGGDALRHEIEMLSTPDAPQDQGLIGSIKRMVRPR